MLLLLCRDSDHGCTEYRYRYIQIRLHRRMGSFSRVRGRWQEHGPDPEQCAKVILGGSAAVALLIVIDVLALLFDDSAKYARARERSQDEAIHCLAAVGPKLSAG